MKEIIHLRIRNRKIEHSTHTVYMLCPADAEVIPNLVLLVLSTVQNSSWLISHINILTQTFIKLREVCRLQNSNGSLPNRDKIRKILTIHLHKYVKLHLTLQKAYKKDNILPLYSILLYQNSMQKIQALFNILALSLVFNFLFEKKVTRMRWA